MTARHRKTACCLVIGNEILSGKVEDLNSLYFARELTRLGVEVKGIFIIPDELEVIADFVRTYSPQVDFLLTSGGVGPTHDDRTMEGIALAFKTELIEDEQIMALLHKRHKDEIPSPLRKMAQIPKGAKLIPGTDSLFPLVCVRNVYIFPGEPQLLRQKFESVKNIFQGTPRKLRKVYINQHEFRFAEQLSEVQKRYPDVAIGSYPKLRGDTFKAMLTFEADEEKIVDEAMSAFLKAVPDEWVVRIE